MRKCLCLLTALLFIIPVVFAQSPAPSVMAERLCKTWQIEKIIQGGTTMPADKTLTDFVLIVHADHTVQQGMYPDGLIKGTWTLDEQARMFTVKDNETATVYPMKIISITADAMELEDQSGNSSLSIFYKSK